MLNVVLVEPENPLNAGNIARICSISGVCLHLVHPLNFRLTDNRFKNAARGFQEQLEVKEYRSFDQLLQTHHDQRFFFVTSKTHRPYTKHTYKENDFFVFGKESFGLPMKLLEEYPDQCIRIPMLPGLNCHNVANSVAIIVYEALKQLEFPNLI